MVLIPHKPVRRFLASAVACLATLSLAITPALSAASATTAAVATASYKWWVEPAQKKVYPDTRPPQDARPAGHRTAPPVRVGAAQAEYEGLQLVLRPSGGAISGVWIQPSDLVRVSGGVTETIPASEVSTYKVHYVNIAKPSTGYSRTGPTPDALIPMTLANGQRLGWQPNGRPSNPTYRTVAAGTTQPFYVLFHVPDGTTPGTYWGSLTVTAKDPSGNALPAQRIPVLLEVFPFSVAQRTLSTSFGISMQLAMYANSATHSWLPRDPDPGPDADRVPERTSYKADQMGGWLRFMAEHRISPQMMLPAWETGSDWAPPTDSGDMVARQAVLDDYLGAGPATTFSGERFAFNSVKMPEYGAPSYVRDPFSSSSATSKARRYWQTMYQELGSYRSKAYAYPVDEPSASQRTFVERYASLVHQTAPGVPFMVTTDPVTMDYRLLSGVDIYGHKLHFFYRRGDQDRWIKPILSSGKKVWIYSHATTFQKDVPMYLLDKPLVESRVQGWFAYHTRASGLLHFSINAWRPHSGSSTYRDPYADPLSYQTSVLLANGDGSLVYPGYYPALGLVLQGAPPVSSLRMEALRDGLEDYEYLKLVEARYSRSRADSFVKRLIGAPAGVYEAGRPTFPAYSKSVEEYESVRSDMAALLGAPGWSRTPPGAAVGGSSPDAWEDNDAWTDAVDITDRIAALPFRDHDMDPYSRVLTFDHADDTTGADEDWLSFDLTPDQVAQGVHLRIEALSADPQVDPVIEVYGPSTPDPTAPDSLPEELDGTGTGTGRTATDPNAVAASDESPWFAERQASAAVDIEPGTAGAAGTYWIRIRPYYQGDFGQSRPVGFGDGVGAYRLRVRNGQVQRLAGSDRFATAVAISQERYAPGDLAGGAVVLATGLSFPDALAGSTLAGAVGGPILLTRPDSLPGAVRSEISRLGARTVYVLGGPRAVSDSVLAAVRSIPGVTRVERVYGRDRYATAAAVARKTRSILGASMPRTAFLASGLNFPDALAAAPVAAANGAPILLTGPASLAPAARSAISDLGITDVIVVGGPRVVTEGARSAAASLVGGTAHTRRVSGANRYETAQRLAEWAAELDSPGADGFVGTSANPQALRALSEAASAGFASGENYPDALAGGALCGLAGSPMLLVEPDRVPSAVWSRHLSRLAGHGRVFGKSYVFGGPAAVSDPAYFQLDALSNWLGVR